MSAITPDPTRAITLNCPKCGVEMRLEPDVTCPDDWANKLAKLCCCGLCADKSDAKYQARVRIRRAAGVFHDWGCRVAQWEAMKNDGISCGERPKDPSQATKTMLTDGVAYFCRYLRLCGASTDPQRMTDMLVANPKEPGQVMYAVESAAFKLKVEAERAAGLPI